MHPIKQIYIDYIGRVNYVSPVMVRAGKHVKKVTIQDEK
jgi:hypothetical protein